MICKSIALLFPENAFLFAFPLPHLLSPSSPPPHTPTQKHQNHSQNDLKSRTRPDPLAILHKNKRDRTQRERDKRQQAIAPAEAQRGVHFLPGEWQTGAGEGAEHRGSCRGAGGVEREGVDEVGLHGHLESNR